MSLLPWENAAADVEHVKHLRGTPYVSTFSDITGRVCAPAYVAVRAGQKTAARMVAEIKPQIEDVLKG